MKPRPRPAEPYEWTYSFIVPLLLYLDDLRDIFGVIEQVGPVQAETDTHIEISSFDDLRQAQGTPATELTARTTAKAGGTLSVWFGRNGASITITSPHPEFVGALHQIQAIAWRHWRRFSLADSGIMFSIPVFLIAFTAVLSGAALAFPWNIVIVGMFAAAAVGMIVLGLGERRSRWTMMPMIWHADRPASFVKRNRDQIILGLIFLAVGYLLGFVTPLVARP